MHLKWVIFLRCNAVKIFKADALGALQKFYSRRRKKLIHRDMEKHVVDVFKIEARKKLMIRYLIIKLDSIKEAK